MFSCLILSISAHYGRPPEVLTLKRKINCAEFDSETSRCTKCNENYFINPYGVCEKQKSSTEQSTFNYDTQEIFSNTVHHHHDCDHEHGKHSNEIPDSQLPIIPYPNSVKVYPGNFTIQASTRVYTNLKGDDKTLFLNYLSHEELPVSSTPFELEKNIIKLLVDETLDMNDEGYNLLVTQDAITLKSKTTKGIFYGIQTILQLYQKYDDEGEIPCCEIVDSPAFEYRGVMLDVSRHFVPLEFIYKQIDMLAHFKINTLHIHLTDTGGWRIEIKQYPLLTQKAAYRNESDWNRWCNSGLDGHYNDTGTPGAYGGFYTQDQMRELDSYATKKFINIVPEIEMPGHSEEVMYAYPEYSCAGQPYVNHDLCIGNPDTFTFLCNVLTEIMDIFPSPYIHIGGDEALKYGWKTCPKCLKVMSDNNFTDFDQLQSYLIKKIEAFLDEHNRHLLGWDEILEGGLPPHAYVMSWTGEQGGIIAAQSGHHVVMSPSLYMYLDHYQDEFFAQPDARLPPRTLQNIYNYHPVPSVLTPDEAKLILGVQGNVWTEFITSPSHVEYMMYPRAMAVSEIGWTLKENKNYHLFMDRLHHEIQNLIAKGYFPHRTDNLYLNRQQSLVPKKHLALNKKVTYTAPYNPNYPAAGDGALVDGQLGGWNFDDGTWQGFYYRNDIEFQFDLTIDLEQVTNIHKVAVNFMRQSEQARIYWPQRFVVSLSSDNVNWNTVLDESYDYVNTVYGLSLKKYTGDGVAAQYVRVQAKMFDDLQDQWLFVDEVVVE